MSAAVSNPPNNRALRHPLISELLHRLESADDHTNPVESGQNRDAGTGRSRDVTRDRASCARQVERSARVCKDRQRSQRQRTHEQFLDFVHCFRFGRQSTSAANRKARNIAVAPKSVQAATVAST